jgi:hypothetical protein
VIGRGLDDDPMTKEKFLTDKEAGLVVNQLKAAMGPGFSSLVEQCGGDNWQKDLVRFMPVSRSCKEAREKKGLSIKEAALALKVPQYRLKAVEGERAISIDPGVLEEYIKFLGLHSWFDNWIRANPDVYARLKQKAKQNEKGALQKLR